MRSSSSKNRKAKCLVYLGLKCRRKNPKRRKKHQRSRRRSVTFPWVLQDNNRSSRVLPLFKEALHRLDRDSQWANQQPQLLDLGEVVAAHLEDSRWVVLQQEMAYLQWDPCTNSHKLKNHSYFSKIALIMSSIRGCQTSTQAFSEQSVKIKLQEISRCQQTLFKRYPTWHIAVISVLRFSRRSILIRWISAKSHNLRRQKDNWMRLSHFWKIISWPKISVSWRLLSLPERWDHKSFWKKKR